MLAKWSIHLHTEWSMWAIPLAISVTQPEKVIRWEGITKYVARPGWLVAVHVGPFSLCVRRDAAELKVTWRDLKEEKE